jgi:hypothetical protein
VVALELSAYLKCDYGFALELSTDDDVVAWEQMEMMKLPDGQEAIIYLRRNLPVYGSIADYVGVHTKARLGNEYIFIGGTGRC